MTRSAFDRRLGFEQGRIHGAQGFDPPEGEFLFVLGSDTPTQFATLTPGDYAEVSQWGTFASAKTLQLRARTRGPSAALPGDLAWFAQIRIDDAVLLEMAVEPMVTRTLTDLALPIGSLVDVHKFACRLVLRGTVTPAADIELPAFYLDALVLDPAFTPRPSLANRDPAPNEDRVHLDTTIALDVLDIGTDGVDEARTRVWIDDVLAFSGSAITAPFAGARSAVTTPSHTLRIVLDPIAELVSQATVSVRVETAIVGGGLTETIYAFTVEDATAPRLISATATFDDRIRVVFNEPMARATLSVGAFTIARENGEVSVPVSPIAIADISEVEVEITANQALTAGATYAITATGVTDKSGNAMVPPFGTMIFTGFVPLRPEDRDWNYFAMMPGIDQEEDAGDLRRFLAVIQELGDLVLTSIDRFTDIIDPDVAPIAFVDAMLDDLGDPFVFETPHLSDTAKRQLVQLLVPIYKQRGTGPGIIAAIAFFLGVEVTLQSTAVAPLGIGEWELGETWVLGTSDLVEIHTFRVLVPRVLTVDERKRMRAIITFMKCEREHFKIIEPTNITPIDEAQHLELGLSELGVNWLLH